MSQPYDSSELQRLIFSCSGAADVGEVADRAARQLSREGVWRMYCLSGIGAANPTILENTEAARTILAIDGCPAACASASLRRAGITRFKSLQLAELGMSKGETPAFEENVDYVVAEARQQFA